MHESKKNPNDIPIQQNRKQNPQGLTFLVDYHNIRVCFICYLHFYPKPLCVNLNVWTFFLR